MIKPEVLHEDSNFLVLARAFDTPLGIVPDVSALPLIEGFTAAGMITWLQSRHPERSWRQNLYGGVLCMLVTLGSEWAHNMAHVFAAKLVGKPTEAVRVVFGMPLLYYRDPNDPTVTPREHIIRASGGPALNLILLPIGLVWQKRARHGTVSRDTADALVAMNKFLLLAGLLPIPELDGGAMLKWAMVDRGETIPQAEAKVRKTNWVTASLLTIGGLLAFLKKKSLLGSLLALLGGLSFLIAKNLIKETPED